jgi:arylsulfatase A-like enzyme
MSFSLICLAFALNALGAATQRPNILFVFIDDIGWGDLSCYGNTVTNKAGLPITPNLDRLASEGVRFTQGYVASPICSASRTAVLTGMQPCRFAMYGFLDNKANNAARNMVDWLQPDTVTAARLFQHAGYKTGQFGKWHMGNGRDVNNAPPPSMYGFDESLVAFEGNGNRLLYYNDDGTKYSLAQLNEDATVGTYRYCYFYEAASNHTDAALSFITNAVSSGKPFYVHVPYNDVHSPYNVAPDQRNDFDHITTDTDAKTYLGELFNLDKQIGRLLAAVDALGVKSNTLVVIAGDNGAPDDNVNKILNRNGILRSGKGNIYEGGIREPFFVRWPGTVPAGVVNSNTPICTLDLLPTYCSIVGLKLPNAPFDGEDMSDVFRGSTRDRRHPLFWEYGTVSGLAPASPKLAIRQGNLKFMRDPEGSRRELYLMPNDSAEATNLVSKSAYATAIAAMEPQLMAWYDSVVLGNVGQTYSCQSNAFSGLVVSDDYNVSGGNSPGSGFGTNAGVNYQFSTRRNGASSSGLFGYRLGGTGGTSPRVASDFSISGNRITVAPRNGNGRFEFSPDGSSGFDFGSYLAGRNYDLSVTMTIDAVGANYAQRLSLSVSDVSNASVDNLDCGMQIGTDGTVGLGVFKRIDASSSTTGADINSRVTNGLPIGVPISLKLRISDYNTDITNFASTYQLFVNNVSVSTGSFRFNASTTTRYIIFDVAAHEGNVHYDDLNLTVTGGGAVTNICRKPILSFSELNVTDPSKPLARLYWSAQPGLTVIPEWSPNLTAWTAITNSTGGPLSVTTPHGTIQWLEVQAPAPSYQQAFFRLRVQ